MLKIFRNDGALKNTFLLVEKTNIVDQFFYRLRYVTFVNDGAPQEVGLMSKKYIEETYNKEDIIYV